jgi:predicted transcriptional regulator
MIQICAIALLYIYIFNAYYPISTGEDNEYGLVVKTVDWKPDGNYSLIGYSGGIMAKYDGISLDYFFIDQLYINQISWNPSGNIALIVGSGGIFKFDEMVLPILKNNKIHCVSVDWNPAGTEALIGGQIEDENGEFHALLLKYDGNNLIDLTWMMDKIDFSITQIQWLLNDNHALIYANNNMLFEYSGNKVSLLIEINNILDIEWNQKNSEVLFLDKSFSLKSWNMIKPFNLIVVKEGEKENILQLGGLSIKPNGNEVLVFGYNQNKKTSKIYSYDESLQLIKEYKEKIICDICWFPDSENALVIGSYHDSGGFIQRIDIIKEVKDSNDLSPILIVSFGSILTFLYLGLTEIGRYRFFKFIFVPFLTKIRKKHPLENQMRELIFKYIEHNPGDNYTTIKKTLGLANGTLVYHLKILKRENLIKTINEGRHKRFFPMDSNILNDNLTYEFNGPQMLSKIQLAILNKMSEEPGISNAEMARSIGISRQLLNYHLNKLLKIGILKSKRKTEAENPT